jgi:hypothetical protein
MSDLQRIKILEDRIEGFELMMVDAESDLAQKRREISTLRAQLTKQERAKVEMVHVQAIFDFWVIACRKDPARVRLTDERVKAVSKALREKRTVADLQLAVEGAARDAFVNAKGKRFDDLELICRKCEDFMDRADACRAADAAKLEAERAEPLPDERIQEAARQILIKNCGRDYDDNNLPRRWSGSFEFVLRELERHNCRITADHHGRARAQCPVHGSKGGTLSIGEGADGRVLLHCFAGCEVDQILGALGLSWAHIGGDRQSTSTMTAQQMLLGGMTL